MLQISGFSGFSIIINFIYLKKNLNLHLQGFYQKLCKFYFISRLFLTPNRLLAEVYRRADQLGHMLSHAESHPTFANNMVQMLSHWMVWFPSDFRDESMQSRVRTLVKLIIEWHPPSETRLNQLMQSLMTQLSAIDRHEKYLDRLALHSSNKHFCQIQDLLETDYSAMVFAQVNVLYRAFSSF